ncbi:hypothetical protein [Gottfriedia solisilvae]|uniref:hypothetical protein n=1 Tax=Gottfriedia solisilvae TaxID=1516104 RepID=UPI003D2F29CA
MKRVIYSLLLALATFLIVLGIQKLFGYKNYHYIMLIATGIIALFVPIYYKKIFGTFGVLDTLLASLFLLILGSVSIMIFPPSFVRDTWDQILPYFNIFKIVLTFFIVSFGMRITFYSKELS